MGASVQGNPSFDPSTLTAFENGTIEILNLDNVPHDIVNGKGPRDNESGKLFDTGIIDAERKVTRIAISKHGRVPQLAFTFR